MRTALATTAFVLALSGAAHADEPRVVLQMNGCSDEAEVRRLVALELNALSADARRADLQTRTDVSVGCEGDRAEVRVERAGQVLERTVERGAPGDRARTLALALTEMVAASWVELRPPPPVTPAAPPPTELLLSGGAESIGAARLSLFGASIGVRLWPGDRWGAFLDLDGRGGASDTRAGSVNVRSASAGAGLVMATRAGAWQLLGTAGARLGVAHLGGGAPTAANVRSTGFTGSWTGPFVGGEVLYPRTGTVALRVRADLGHTLRGVSAKLDGREELVALRGPWLSVGAGVAIRL